MNRQEKESVVNQLHEDFMGNQALFLVGFRGMSVANMQALRRQLHEKGGLLKVAKIRLMKRAVKDINKVNLLMPYLKGQLALVFSVQEPPAIAKVLYDFAKDNEQLHLIAGCLDSELLTHDEVLRIAKLPSKEVLYSQLCVTLNTPVMQLMNVLNQPIIQLLNVLKQVVENEKEKEERS